MVEILTGSNGSVKSKEIADRIKQSISKNVKVCVIVPEQFAYEYDKMLYKNMGPSLFNSIKVVSFSKIAGEIINTYGSEKGTFTDDNAKLIMMYQAIKKIHEDKTSRFFTRQLEKPQFIYDSIEMIDEIQRAEVSVDLLQSTSEKIGGVLGDKLYDLSLIYNNYSKNLSDNNLKDMLTAIGKSADIASVNHYFNGYTVFIDKFSSFSADETKFLKVIVSQAKNITIALTKSNYKNSETKMSPFTNVEKTIDMFIKLAHDYAHEYKIVPIENIKYKNKSLLHIDKNIFYPIAEKTENSTGVKIIKCSDFYDEMDFVSATISHLVREGYKYNDIAVVSRQLSDYQNIISSSFDRYNISYFMDIRQQVSSKALILYVLSALETLTTRKYSTERILRYVKSQLSPYDKIEAYKLEDYCFRWKVNGDMWLEDFNASVNSHYEYSYDLVEINRLRKSIITPLEEFKQKCNNTSGVVISRAFMEFLSQTGIDKKISSLVNQQTPEGEIDADLIETAREFRQLWKELIKAVRSIYNCIGEKHITLKEFYDILKLILGNTTVATPPQKLDAVMVSSAERSILAEPKVVFVVGVNDGIMPYSVHEKGFFSDRDKEYLRQSGIEISRSLMSLVAEERFIAYCAMTSASEKLYVTYPMIDAGCKKRRQSTLITNLCNLFEGNILSSTADFNETYFCTTKEGAYYKYVENIRDKTKEQASIFNVLNADEHYTKKLEYLSYATNEANHKLDDKDNRNIYLQKNKVLSATSINQFSQCPFSYFCKYGLDINAPISVEINHLNRGNVVHYCLEKILSVKDKNHNKKYNSDFVNYTDDEIKKLIHKYVTEYKDSQMGGDFGKTKRFDYLFSRYEIMLFEVVTRLRTEFKSSDFVPDSFEYNLTKKDGTSLFELKVNDAVTISLKGKIDRIDVYEKDNQKYIRIVDYKTGSKEFSFADIYNGIDLQMILYLIAISRGACEYNDCQPAGMLYMPASFPDFFLKSGTYSEKDIMLKIDKEKLAQYRMFGLIIDISNNIDEMKKLVNDKFIKLSRDKEEIVTPKVYDRLADFVLEKIEQMINAIKEGKIDALPVKSKYNPCDSCDYWSVCGHYMTPLVREVTKDDGKKLLDMIKTDDKEGESDEC